MVWVFEVLFWVCLLAIGWLNFGITGVLVVVATFALISLIAQVLKQK